MSLPWDEVNAVDSRKVASLLRLEAAREKDKYACVECSSSDGLHAYQSGGLKCYSCGKRWSNVDAAAHVWGLSHESPPLAALKRLAADLGVYMQDTPPVRAQSAGRYAARRRTPTKTPPRPKKTPLRASQEVDETQERLQQEVFGEILYLTGLSSTASAFLESRGLDAEGAEAYGFRSISPREWQDVGAKLESMTPEHREVSGLYTSSGWGPPFGGYAEVLVLPYYRESSDHAPRCLRFRNLSATSKGNRYRDLHGNRPTFPFNAQAMTADDLENGREIVLTEGELDAYTLHERGEVALGFSGTSLVGLEWLLPRLRVAGKVVAFFDADDAGDKAVEKLRDALQAEYGPEWVKDKLTRRRPMAGKDANDLRVKGLI